MKNRWKSLIKLAITGVCLTFLYLKIREKKLWIDADSFPDFFVPTILVLLVLMVFNWYLEACRWKLSIQSFEGIGMRQAMVDVLVGLAMNFVTPFTSGDFIVRLIDKQNKPASVSAILLNRMIMLLLTLLLGFYGVVVLLGFIEISFWRVLIALVIVSIVGYYIKSNKKFQPFFITLTRNVVIGIVGLSILRYFIFTLQFFIILTLFSPDLPVNVVVGGIGWIFLFKSIIPSLVGGLGLRETSAIFFFQNFADDLSGILFAIFVLWLINTALPSLFGAILISKLKVKIAG